MALATTCPQCKTSFKVVPDQLKLRRGLVRCGVCQHVFSGVEHLRYVDKDENTEKVQPATAAADEADSTIGPAGHGGTTDATPAGGPATLPGPAAEAADHDAARPGSPSFPLPAAPDGQADEATASHDDNPAQAPAIADAPPTSALPSGLSTGQAGGNDDPPTTPGRGRNRRRSRKSQASPPAAPPPARDDDNLDTVFFMADHDGDSDPEDVRLPDSLRAGSHASQPGSDLDPDTLAAGKVVSEANRIWRQQKPRSTTSHEPPAPRDTGADGLPAASDQPADSGPGRWLTPARRRWLTIALAVLALIQLLAVFRTEIAYRLPFLRPLASLASALTGQSIQPPMSLATLSIESFELRGTQQPGQTRLTAILRNRSALPARWPAMELTLTGPSNTVLVRKVLLPGHYLPASHDPLQGLAANTEFPLDLLLETQDLNLAGYSVALFYPTP